MTRRHSLASLLGLLVAVVATLVPARTALAQDPGSIAGVVTSGRSFVENAVVVLSNADGPIARTATTADGRFAFASVPAGRYHLAARKDGVGTAEGDLAVRPGTAARIHLNLVNHNPGALAGLVFNADGPVADATVVVSNPRGEVARGTTNADGQFGFRQLPPGQYNVRAAKNAVGQGGARVTIVADQVTHTRIELRGAAGDTGAVGGVVSNAVGPVSGAVVVIGGPRGPVAQTTTNENGVYLFRAIRPGHYVIHAAKPGVGQGSTEADVVAGAAVRAPITLVAPPRAGALNGHVGANGAIVAGAEVVLSSNGTVVGRMLSDRDGGFSFANLRPGHYVVTAAKRGVGQGRVEADVTSGATTTVRVILQ